MHALTSELCAQAPPHTLRTGSLEPADLHCPLATLDSSASQYAIPLIRVLVFDPPPRARPYAPRRTRTLTCSVFGVFTTPPEKKRRNEIALKCKKHLILEIQCAFEL